MKKRRIKSRPIHQLTIAQFEAMFPNEDACAEYLTANRWPEGVRCPRCDHDKVWALDSKPHHWVCKNCATDGYRFSVLVGTIFENTNKDLREWFRVIHLMVTSKKGISAMQVKRYMGFGSYETAWSMCHKIRIKMGDEDFRQLVGYVEVDETFVGGKAKNKHKDKRGGPGGTGSHGGTGGFGKSIVVGAVQRKGKVIARVVHGLDSDTLCNFVREVVSHKVSLLATDERRGYRPLRKEYKVGAVDHWSGEYVNGAIHTNTIEGFWSLVKRGIIGTYHKVSAKYLPLYVNEFQFRYNHRKDDRIFDAAIRAC
jgi:transposase-like protein